jgi:hypothetical protein
MLDLHEILNISEDGVAIQCNSRLEIGRSLHVCLDLAEASGPVHTMGRVVWSDATARAGLSFSELPPASLLRLREWLFLNVMTGAAHREEMAALAPLPSAPPLPNYSDTLAAVTAVQRQVEALGSELSGALQLVADRAQNLVRASGAAIALATEDADVMECRASSGPDAPPVGARLQVGSGFSGECVKSGRLLRCDDSELDARVDRESCRALGIRSMLAVPLRMGENPVGILEVFSPQPNSFTESDARVLQRLGETILAAIHRATNAGNSAPPASAASADRFPPRPGSVLFASTPQSSEKNPEAPSEEKTSGGFSVLRSHLIILIMAFCAVSLALGYLSAEWLKTDVVPWLENKLHAHAHAQLQTVLASSSPTTRSQDAPASSPSVETATLNQLEHLAENGDAAAQNSLGLRYATGDGVKLDEHQSFHWFTRAAEQGNVAAQSKLGSLCLSGRGVQQDYSQAYFWMALARASGDETSKVLAPMAEAHLTRDQITSIELQADRWLQQHQFSAKPPAGH